MRKKKIYLLFSDTGTSLSRAINCFTHAPLNHVSIAFEADLEEVYSFGRKNPHNPFSGGFVREEIYSDFLKDSQCEIYEIEVEDRDCHRIMEKMRQIEAEKDDYKYNFLGLLAVLFDIELKRPRAMFCSQFVSHLLYESDHYRIDKPHCLTTPEDIRRLTGLKLIYKGVLGQYRRGEIPNLQSVHKQSFLFIISEKMKQIVLR